MGDNSTDLLEHVTILEETLLGDVRLLQLDAQIQVFEHDGLDDLLRPGIGEFLVAENFLECVQGTSRLSHFDEFCKRKIFFILLLARSSGIEVGLFMSVNSLITNSQ